MLDPDREPYYLTVPEALAVALERGTVGGTSVRVPGLPNEELISLGGQSVIGSDSIRVLAFEPARAGTAIEARLARFDPLWTTGINWTTTDQPTQGLSSLSNGQAASFFSTLAKPLASGGVAGVTFSTDYQLLANPPGGAFGVLSPSYTPKLTLGFEQPLLRGFGTDINQLNPGFAGGSLFPGLGGRPSASAGEGILLARLRFDQSRAELERSVNYLLLNVEAAYRNLYGAYVNLYVAEPGLRLAHQVWVVGKDLEEGGKLERYRLAQMRGQLEQFRADRQRALGAC